MDRYTIQLSEPDWISTIQAYPDPAEFYVSHWMRLYCILLCLSS